MKYDFYITGTIGVAYDWWTGHRGTTANMVKNFLKEHKNQEVTIAVSSLGGYIDDGITIMEYIKDHGKCNMVIIGMTASAATILCMKAKSVKIARGSMMLIHNSSQMLDVWTSANKEQIDSIIKQFQHEREQLDTIDKCLADIYTQKNGKTLEENLSLMGQEKWLSAQDAKEFGLVDAVLDDDDDVVKAKAVKNAYAGIIGASEHYGLPQFAEEEKPSRSFFQRMKEALKNVSGIMNDAEPQDNSQTNTIVAMKKIVLNLICAILAIKDIAVSEKGEATLTEDQLNTLEKELKAKDDLINQLKAEKKTAEDAKATAEKNQADLQKQFDNFKAEAGDETKQKPADEDGKHTPATAKDMYQSIKNLL
jgi:ATP-dependent protease ClpP protease subunit